MDESNNQDDNYDLEERTAKFAESIIDLTKKIKVTEVNKRIIPQLVAAGGSTAANYCEATEAESKKDFTHKISIVKKEDKEAKLWLRLLARSNPEHIEEIRKLWQEASELVLIFAKIVRSCRKKNEN